MTTERFRVKLLPAAEKDLEKLGQPEERIIEILTELETNPRKGDALTGALRGSRALKFQPSGERCLPRRIRYHWANMRGLLHRDTGERLPGDRPPGKTPAANGLAFSAGLFHSSLRGSILGDHGRDTARLYPIRVTD